MHRVTSILDLLSVLICIQRWRAPVSIELCMLHLGPPLFPPTDKGLTSAAEEEEQVPVFHVLFFLSFCFFVCFVFFVFFVFRFKV